jgi:hypothetical protein
MSNMRGVAAFDEIWSRRTTLADDAGFQIEVMGLADLITAKKTQRDKDWPMIRRLVEAHYSSNHAAPSDEQIDFWLRECRTPDLLIDLALKYQAEAEAAATQRPSVAAALRADRDQVLALLGDEERREHEADRAYWEPLKRELEEIRRQRRNS